MSLATSALFLNSHNLVLPVSDPLPGGSTAFSRTGEFGLRADIPDVVSQDQPSRTLELCLQTSVGLPTVPTTEKSGATSTILSASRLTPCPSSTGPTTAKTRAASPTCVFRAVLPLAWYVSH